MRPPLLRNAAVALLSLVLAPAAAGAEAATAPRASTFGTPASPTAGSTGPAGSSLEAGWVVARPVDHGRALVNPSMGWTFHHYSNIIENYGSRLELSDTLDDFPGLSTIYLRLPWSFIEPEEGKFRWSIVDAPSQRWISRGLRVAFRFSTTESWLRHATPEWVKDAGANGYEFRPGRREAGGPFWEPDYGDPVFLRKLESFLAAAASRYDGSPHVDFIDVGSFGVWGEGHTFSSTAMKYPEWVIRHHVDLHVKHFRRTLLAVNDDMAFFDDEAEGLDILKYPGRETIRYAHARGLTLRDDSILVQPPPHHYFNASMAEAFWRDRPVILECQHYGPSKRSGAWGDGSLYLKAVEEYHASYAAIHWWPREFLREQRDLVDRMNRRLGYRLVPREVAWPARVGTKGRFEIRSRWANVGVAPCYPGGHVAYTLRDARGGIAAVLVDESRDVRAWPPGPPGRAPVVRFRSDFGLARNTRPGTYELHVSVGDSMGTPRIALPLAGGDGKRRYRLGTIEVVEGAAPAPGGE